MAHRGMKKLRQIEKIGLVGLCVLMLTTLGIGMGSPLRSCSGEDVQGSFTIDGEEVGIDNAEYLDYRGYQLFQNRVMPHQNALTSYYGIAVPPPWKYASFADEQFRQYQADEKDLWTFIVLDHVAARAGIEIAPEMVKEFLQGFHLFQENGEFSKEKYDQFLSQVSGTWATAGEFEKFVGRYLRVSYLLSNYTPLARPTHQQIYEDWKNRNRRHDFDYVVQPLAPIREEIDPASFPTSEVETFYAKEDVKSDFRIPTQWSFEADYLIPADLSEEAFAELRKKAEDLGVTVSEDQARNYYFANPELYDVEAVRRRLKADWEEKQAEKKAAAEKKPGEEGSEKPGEEGTEKAGEEGTTEPGGEAGGTDEDREEVPDDPAADPAPEGEGGPPAGGEGEQPAAGEGEQPAAGEGEQPAAGEGEPAEEEWKDPLESMKPAEIYATYFQARVERDVLARELLKRLLMDERIQQVGLEKLAADWGLSHYRTEQPLDGLEVLTNRPVGGQDLRSHLVKFEGGDDGKYSEEIVRIGGLEPAKTGWCFFRVIEVIPEHFPQLSDPMPAKRLRDAVLNSNLRVDYGEAQEMAPAKLLQAAYGSQVDEKETYTVEDVVRLMLRESKAVDRAVEKLTALKERVLSGNQSFEPAAEELGYEVREVRGATEECVVPEAETAPADEELTAAQREHNRLLAERRFLLKGRVPAKRANLERVADARADTFLDEILTDERTTDAAYLVYVRSHRIPGPEEMPEGEAQQIAQKLASSQLRPTLRDFFSFDAMSERYDIHVKGMEKKTDQSRGGTGS